MTTMTVEGGDAFEATLHAASEGIAETATAKTEAGRLVASRAVEHAPKASGTLSRSIHASTEGDVVSVSTDLLYGAVQEYGWSGHNIAAHPYMRPALADSTDQIVAAYARDVQNELNNVRGT